MNNLKTSSVVSLEKYISDKWYNLFPNSKIHIDKEICCSSTISLRVTYIYRGEVLEIRRHMPDDVHAGMLDHYLGNIYLEIMRENMMRTNDAYERRNNWFEEKKEIEEIKFTGAALMPNGTMEMEGMIK